MKISYPIEDDIAYTVKEKQDSNGFKYSEWIKTSNGKKVVFPDQLSSI